MFDTVLNTSLITFDKEVNTWNHYFVLIRISFQNFNHLVWNHYIPNCSDILCCFNINPLTTNVPHHRETSQLIYIANHLTGFYMMGNIGRNGLREWSKIQVIFKVALNHESFEVYRENIFGVKYLTCKTNVPLSMNNMTTTWSRNLQKDRKDKLQNIHFHEMQGIFVHLKPFACIVAPLKLLVQCSLNSAAVFSFHLS